VIDLPEDVPCRHRDAVESKPADGMVGDKRDRLPGQAWALPRDRERSDAPGARARRGAREHGVDIGVGGVGDEDLVSAQPESSAVGFGGERDRGNVGSGVGLGQRERGDGLAAGDPGDPAVDDLGAARCQDGMGAQSLEREGGLGLG
jgi:hypothetical protein